jgi:hypothetical protein
VTVCPIKQALSPFSPLKRGDRETKVWPLRLAERWACCPPWVAVTRRRGFVGAREGWNASTRQLRAWGHVLFNVPGLPCSPTPGSQHFFGDENI